MTEQLPPPTAGTSVTLSEPVLPRRGWRRPAAVGAVSVLAVAGVVTVAALAGGDDDGPTYSLVDAPAAADELDALRYEISLDGMPMLDSVSIEAIQDVEQERISLEMSLGELLGGSLQMVGDLDEGVIYLGGDFLGGMLPGDASWVRVDEDQLDDLGGLEGFGDQLDLDPLAVLDDSDLAGAQDQGFDEVDGIRTKRYSLSVDAEGLLEQSGILEGLGGEMLPDLPDSIEVLVWVDEANLVRQLTYEVEILGQSLGTTVRIDPSDESVDLPDPDDVIDVSAIAGLLN